MWSHYCGSWKSTFVGASEHYGLCIHLFLWTPYVGLDQSSEVQDSSKARHLEVRWSYGPWMRAKDRQKLFSASCAASLPPSLSVPEEYSKHSTPDLDKLTRIMETEGKQMLEEVREKLVDRSVWGSVDEATNCMGMVPSWWWRQQSVAIVLIIIIIIIVITTPQIISFTSCWWGQESVTIVLITIIIIGAQMNCVEMHKTWHSF